MSKEIWLGPVLGNNRERLLARCAEYISKGQADRLLYIAASHPLLDLVTEKLLDGNQAPGVWGEFPVYLFRGFVRRVLSSAILSEARPSGRATIDTEPLLTRGLLTRTNTEPLLTRGLLTRVAIDREELPLRRSLISQIIKQLAAAGALRATKSLANRDGCVNTIGSMIGELQRAGKTPQEFQTAIESRASEFESRVHSSKSKVQTSLRSQLDFDREVALIYSAYTGALDHFDLTDEDADQLRALQILRGEVDGREISLPWLEHVELLVLDGFFDFTPVQGEMLRCLIPVVPNAIVNLNYDHRNEEIFQPFRSTVDQLKSIANFETKFETEATSVSDALGPLRERLFNVAGSSRIGPDVKKGLVAGRMPAVRTQDAGAPEFGAPEMSASKGSATIKLFECSDRDTEIRSIAKEIKRLVFHEGYKLSDIALVVRERAAYADIILRVFAEESIPCNLERRIEAREVSCLRAGAKLFQLLMEPQRQHVINPKASDLAHIIKSDYFRVSADDIETLAESFDSKYKSLLEATDSGPVHVAPIDENGRVARLRAQLGIGRWAPDILENVIAYVGSELRVQAWVERAQRLIDVLPSPEAARSFIGSNENEGEDTTANIEEESTPDDASTKERRKRPAPVHPAAIAWAILVMEHLRRLIASVPGEGTPEDLRASLMLLLDHLEFSKQVSRPLISYSTEVSHATLDVRGLESLRRAFAAAVRSFQYAHVVVSEARALANVSKPSLNPSTQPSYPAGDPAVGLPREITLSGFIDEVQRCVQSQVLSVGVGNRDGLRVLEATDVRGLRFRAVLIAGMNEASFPLRISGDWLYPHEERQRLRKYGIILEDISSDTLLKEEHYFYQAACRATGRLYLTRPLVLNDGTETVASYYIQELKRAIAPAQIETVQIRGDIDTKELQQASTASELSTLLVRQNACRNSKTPLISLSKTTLKKLTSEAQLHGYISNSALRRIQIERERNGSWFGPFDGEISSPELRAMLARHFGPEYVYSASGLSSYGNCPFKFFAARVLKLEPRNEAALDLPAIDAGKLLHEVLRRFFTGHRNQYLPSLNREELRNEMAEVANKVFREHEQLVPALNERIWKIDCEIRRLILEQVLLYELRLQERTNPRGIRPTYFELAFGRSSDASDPDSSAEYLKLDRAGDNAAETALVQGQIDRVDLNERDRIAIAYDYKLSQGAKLNDIEAGRQVQIPIYLAALEQLFVPGYELAGGGYYRLRGRGPRLNQGLYRRAFEDCTHVTGWTMSDDPEWQRIRNEVRKQVWHFIDGMRSGEFKVKPSLGRQTCKFCDYSAICRYDTYRISRKR